MNDFLTWLLGERLSQGAEGKAAIELTAELDNYVALGLVLALAALAYLVVRTYRREGDAPKRSKGLLAGLRLLVVLLVMLVILRPAIVHRVVRELHSSVVVLMDDSISMSYTDRYGDQPAYAEALAKTIGVTPQELSGLSRQEIARRVLTAAGGPLELLAKDHPVVVMRYSTTQPGVDAYTRTLGSIDAVQSARLASKPATAPAAQQVRQCLAQLKGAGLDTRIPTAIRDAVEMMQGGRVAAMVVVSDGQNTAQDAQDRLGGVLQYAADRKVPLYALTVGDPTPPRNIAVAALGAPREARKGAKLEFNAVVSHRNAQGQTVKLRIQRRAAGAEEWTDTDVEKEITLEKLSTDAKSASGVQNVQVQVEADTVGEFVYRAVIDPQPYEQNLTDNSAQAVVNVGEELINVLLIAGDGGWEYQFLRNFLMSQPKVYRTSIWQQSLSEGVNQMSSSPEMRLTKLPRELDSLMGVKGDAAKPGYDVVILYDPKPTAEGFDPAFCSDLLQKFVERGRGLCYIAGNKYTEGTLLANKDFSPLGELLPVILSQAGLDFHERIGRTPEPWQVQLAQYGKDHQVTRLSSGADADGAWRALPGIYWTHPVARVKPAGHILAVNSNPTRRTSKNDPEPILVTQQYGKGRVLYMGSDDTWRWRAVRDGYYYRRFWSNVVSHLATARTGRVTITAGGDRFCAGDKIVIEVEAYDEKHQPLRDKTFVVEMIDSRTQAAKQIELAAVPDRPGRYKAEYRAVEVGSFELTALRDRELPADQVVTKRIEIELPQAEAMRTEADEDVMKTIAARPENFMRPHEASRLAQLVPPDRLQSVETRQHELWDTNLMLLAIVSLLAAEWIIRKKHNMA
jgi:hypothetical protein